MAAPARKTISGETIQPDKTHEHREEDGGDVVDGEGNAGGRCDVSRIGDFLEVSFHRDGHGEEGVVENVEACRNPGVLDEGIGCEDDNQPDIFDGER